MSWGLERRMDQKVFVVDQRDHIPIVRLLKVILDAGEGEHVIFAVAASDIIYKVAVRALLVNRGLIYASFTTSTNSCDSFPHRHLSLTDQY